MGNQSVIPTGHKKQVQPPAPAKKVRDETRQSEEAKYDIKLEAAPAEDDGQPHLNTGDEDHDMQDDSEEKPKKR